MQVVIDIPDKEIDESLLESKHVSEMEKKRWKAGDTITAYGIEWEVLDPEYKALDGEGILVLAKEPIKEMAFSEDGKNDYSESDIVEYLGELSEQMKDDGAEFLRAQLHLIADDGTGAGIYFQYDGLFLLTDEMYRKYHFDQSGKKIISDKSKPWWTATAYSFSSSYSYIARFDQSGKKIISDYSYIARFVDTDGSLSSGSAYHGDIGVSPACVFLPSCLEKEVKKNNKAEVEMLLKDVIRKQEDIQGQMDKIVKKYAENATMINKKVEE